MATRDELIARRAALEAALHNPNARVAYDGRMVEKRPVTDIAKAIADIDRQLGTIDAPGRRGPAIRQIFFNSRKGC